MFKIWQTECIRWNETQGRNFSHSLFILLTRCGKTLILFPWNVPPTRTISLFLLIVIKSYESKKQKKKRTLFFLIFSCFTNRPRWSDARGAAASSAFCIQTKLNPSWPLTLLRYLFPEITSSWSETEVTASSFGWKPPSMQHCAETVWLIANKQSHFDNWNFSVFLTFKCEQMT